MRASHPVQVRRPSLRGLSVLVMKRTGAAPSPPSRRTGSAHYEFRVSGHLSERARDAVVDLGEMRTVQSCSETIIHGAVPNESGLARVLAVLEDLGLQLVSLRRVPEVHVPK